MPKIKTKKPKVLMCLSGGVDSSVSAALLQKQGYDVTGAFMVNYDSGRAPVGDAGCWLPEYRDALRVAAHLGIPLLKLDFTKEYSEKVLKYMYSEYKKGRTPNPDVLCNTYIKFGVWLDWAREHGFEKLATGHYANLTLAPKHLSTTAQYQLLQAKDKNKDQTYFLHQLNQEQLQHVLFPIGDYTKQQVRSLAKKFKLPTATKEESMGICFVGEVPMKEFLQKKIKPKPGKIIQTNGEVVGAHEGLPFYTIGQRHFGPRNNEQGTTNNKPLFVIDKDMKKNLLIVGHENDPMLYKKEIILTDVHWTNGQPKSFPVKCEVRLRHRQLLQKAVLRIGKKDQIILQFAKATRAPTPGQFAVFYQSGVCLGGGIIASF
ncbi:MAG: tRNA 2-thiouridine(34) synthase MnmA [Candidatus Magasanikbacteria bacterium]|nr:tRNA 2-thiouridine(34) synthase MnmA [Candidatus Magasanikbacteria bacterium]